MAGSETVDMKGRNEYSIRDLGNVDNITVYCGDLTWMITFADVCDVAFGGQMLGGSLFTQHHITADMPESLMVKNDRQLKLISIFLKYDTHIDRCDMSK